MTMAYERSKPEMIPDQETGAQTDQETGAHTNKEICRLASLFVKNEISIFDFKS